MQTSVMSGKYSQLVIPNSDNIGTVDFDVELPTQVVLKFSGKNSDTDTLIDENGNIISDMYVKINSASMDGFDLNKIFLHQKIKLLTESGQAIQTSYFGFNGISTIEMPESSVFSQYLLMNSCL
jgi:hypothetical protein